MREAKNIEEKKKKKKAQEKVLYIGYVWLYSYFFFLCSEGTKKKEKERVLGHTTTPVSGLPADFLSNHAS